MEADGRFRNPGTLNNGGVGTIGSIFSSFE